jgi:molecular chaperone IbpA
MENMKMTTFDFTPLFRSGIGFDRLTNALENAHRTDNNTGYPPYNIELFDENKYRISLAVAGFKDKELDIEINSGRLTVKGSQQQNKEGTKFLHHGIANRNFERSYQLADYVVVKGAELKDGLLHIDLTREIPEAMKPRKVEISMPQQSEKLIDAENRAA